MQLAQYIRMSTVHQSDSPETQKSIIKEYCRKHGHTIVKTYEDDAVSAGSIEKRDALIEMIMDAEKQLFDGIIIYKYDRAFRNLEEQVFVFKRLKKYNTKIIAVADPNSEGASGELIVNILGAVNQFERQLTGERIYDKRRELTKKGRWSGGGMDPLGYRYDKTTKTLNVVEEEAEVFRLMCDLYLKEQALTHVADILNDMGKKTKTGRDWNERTVHQTLTNPLYIGKLRWGYMKPNRGGRNPNCEVFDGIHEPLIDKETFYKIQEILANNKKYVTNYMGTFNLLGGLLKCGVCGGMSVANYKKDKGKHVYMCKDRHRYGKNHCQGWHRMGYKIEDAVHRALIRNINNVFSGGYIQKGQHVKVDKALQIKKKIESIEIKLSRQIEMYEEGIIDKDSFKERRLKTLQEKELLEKELLVCNTAFDEELINAITNFEQSWANADFSIKKKSLRIFIQRIETDGFKIKIFFKDLGLPGWRLTTESRLK